MLAAMRSVDLSISTCLKLTLIHEGLILGRGNLAFVMFWYMVCRIRMVGSIGVNSVIVPFRVVKFANIHRFRHGLGNVYVCMHMYTL